ncbi:hypothetical protein, partial [Flavobacterium sp.]|uniref:hypothetical protein n=1 Tax=Flavobacterium sp. TaxID=239 RepID=UPI0037BF0D78
YQKFKISNTSFFFIEFTNTMLSSFHFGVVIQADLAKFILQAKLYLRYITVVIGVYTILTIYLFGLKKGFVRYL